MLNPIINIFLPIAILLTLSDEDRLGPIPAVLLAVGIPVIYGTTTLLRSRKVNAQSILGITSVLLTGVIAVFRLDTALFPVKEAAVPIGFAVILLVSNRTSFPVVKLLFDMVLRKEKVERDVRELGEEAAYRAYIERCGLLWAGIMTLSGILKFALSSFIVTAPVATPEFNHQLATYEIAQMPTTMMLSMVLILSLIWYIGKGTAQIVDSTPSEVLRGGKRMASMFDKIGRITRRVRPTRIAPDLVSGARDRVE
ncbi:MAG TPA: VC0807 family protein [Thermomicrobiales bacterium]|nr:VC0807 family protein [Thermomicrobiales bacterium]